MPKRYHVDWDDPYYPQIRITSADSVEDRLTYAQAKAEIIEKMRLNIADARSYIAEVRSWRASDLTEEDE